MPPIRAFVCILALCGWTWSLDARAQSARTRSAGTEQASSEYRRAIEEALVEFEAGRYAEARVLFTRAHELEPNARTARGIGSCAFELSDYLGAIVAFEEALSSERRPLDARLRQQTEQLLARARTFVGRVNLIVEPSSARVTVDGHPPVTREGAILLNPGEHEIRIESEGLASEVRHVRVEAAAPVSMQVSLVPPPVVVPAGIVAAPSGSFAPPSASRDTANDDGESRRRRRRRWIFAATGVVVAGAIAIPLAIHATRDPSLTYQTGDSGTTIRTRLAW